MQAEEEERIKKAEDITLSGRVGAMRVEHERERGRGEGGWFGTEMQRSGEDGLRKLDRGERVAQGLGGTVGADMAFDEVRIDWDLDIDQIIKAAGEDLEQSLGPPAEEAVETLHGQGLGLLTSEEIQEDIDNMARPFDEGRL
jgi:hypothetical protein